jgi:hypothetical protein
MTRWPLHDARLAGALATWRGNAPFDRAPVVLERAGEYLVVRRWVGDEAEGEVTPPEEWEALQTTGQAMALDGLPDPKPGVWFWLLRPSLPLEGVREHLEAAGVLVGGPLAGPAGATGYVVVERGSDWLREGWAAGIDRAVERHAAAGRWTEARGAAAAAFHVGPIATEPRAARYAWTLECSGEEQRSKALVAMLSRSFGPAFGDGIRSWLDRLAAPAARRRWMADRRREALGRPPAPGREAA